HYGFLPDYLVDLTDINPGAVRLRRSSSQCRDDFGPAVQTALANVHTRLADLQRSLCARTSELEAAHRHIATLEEKLLKLKHYRRELILLKEQRQALRKSAERRVGQVLLAPYRLPEKVLKKAWKKLHPHAPKRWRELTEYQRWFEHHRAKQGDLDRMRQEISAFRSVPLISVITPVFETPVPRLEKAAESVLAQIYGNWELILVDDGSTAA